MALKILRVENGTTPNEEKVWIQATTATHTKGFALVDRTFDEKGNVSNEFKHIYVFPNITLSASQKAVIYTGKGENGEKTFLNSTDKYYALFWGADNPVWNNRGGDTATLISFVVVDSANVPAVGKK